MKIFQKFACLFRGHDYHFTITPGMVGIFKSTASVDAVRAECTCQRCGKYYGEIQDRTGGIIQIAWTQ